MNVIQGKRPDGSSEFSGFKSKESSEKVWKKDNKIRNIRLKQENKDRKRNKNKLVNTPLI